MASNKTKQPATGAKKKAPAKAAAGTGTKQKKTGAATKTKTASKKTPSKKTPSKKTASKPAPAKKAATKKAPAKKPATKQAPAKPAAGKKAAAKKAGVSNKAASKPTAAKPAPTKKPAAKPAKPSRSRSKKATAQVKSPFSHTDHADVVRGVEARKAAAKARQARSKKVGKSTRKSSGRRLTDKQLISFESMLRRIRAELIRQIAYLRGASLTRADEVNPEEDGTDAFERQLALKLAAGEGDSIFEIDEALERIRNKTYGVCEECGCLIPLPRLKALPFARRCVECQSQIEQNHHATLNDHRYL